MILSNFIEILRFPFRKDKALRKELKKILGFYPDNIEYYRLALSHKSAVRRASNGKRINNGQLCADNISYADMGTGIIAADVADNIFTLRRNHKYVLVCNSSEAVFNNHEID